MALAPGSAPAASLPTPKQAVAHTRAQNGQMTKRGRPAPRRRNLASAAAGAGGGPAAPPTNPYQAQAQAQLDPIIAAITAAARGQASSADAAIQGLTDNYAKGIASIDYGAPYSGAEAQQAAVDAALQQSATGQGSDLAAALSQRLAALQGSSGERAVQQESGALASQGAGIGGAQLASGSAALNQLISDAAAAKGYGQKMPGVIRSAGLQGVEQAQGQAQQAINSGTLQAESQLPQIEQNLQANDLQAQANAADAAYKKAELQSTNAYRNAEITQRAQALGISRAKAAAQIKQGAARIGISQQNADTAAERAAQSAFNSNRSYKLSLSRLGIEQQNLQLRQLAAEAKLQGGGYTPSENHKMQVQANAIASGADKHSASLQQLMHTMALNDIPPTLALKAAKLVGYKPGKVGMFAGLGAAFKKAGGNPLGAGGAVESAAGQTIVNLAQQYKGTPYVWGGESPKGFDCSGFAQYLYGKAGIPIPRTTYTQWTAGRAVSKRQLAPGDLVFFKGSDSRGGLPGHVGIFIGGDKMIDAPHTGADVRVESVGSFGGYMGARRYGK